MKVAEISFSTPTAQLAKTGTGWFLARFCGPAQNFKLTSCIDFVSLGTDTQRWTVYMTGLSKNPATKTSLPCLSGWML